MDISRLLALLWLLTASVGGSKILVLMPMGSTSHKNVFIPVVEELASRGHKVTFFSPVKPKKESSPNVREVTLPQSMKSFMQNIQKTLFVEPKSEGLTSFIGSFTPVKNMLVNSCEHFFNDSTTKALLKEGKKFDVALVSEFFNDCALGTAYVLAKHVIYFSTSGQFPWIPTQVPQPTSYVPNPTLGFSDHMTFYERLINTVFAAGARILYRYLVQPISQELLEKYVPEAPHLDDANKNIAFTLLNVDTFFATPRPSMPNVINIGAAHCRPAKPLPKEFEDFIESSGEDGFIVFGLGSVAQSQFIPTHVRDAFLSALKRLKQKVIWKYEADLPNLPENVKITKWMPQQDLLGHPKIRLFMTHGGLLSLEEALYHAVPIVGIPLFADQPGNVGLAKQRGIGESLDHKNITSDAVYNTITKVLNDPRYKENMKRYSSIQRDQPERPLDRAIFWIEYVIRHDGAQHLQPASEELNFFQYFLLDVVGFLLLATVATLCIVVFLVKFTVRKVRKLSSKQHVPKNKKD